MERNQDIITFTTEEGEVKFHVIEETRINGRDYLLVLDDIEDEEQEALILKDISAEGNGRLDAVSNAIKQHLGIEYSNLTYTEHALSAGSKSKAVTYVSITDVNGKTHWGAGIHDDIIAASICALISAINKAIDA